MIHLFSIIKNFLKLNGFTKNLNIKSLLYMIQVTQIIYSTILKREAVQFTTQNGRK